MKLCACNNCGILYEDMNPQVDAPEYADIMVPSLVQLQDTDDIPLEELQAGNCKDIPLYWGCPKCNTDGYLSDDSLAHFAKEEPNKAIIEAAIAKYELLEDYQEEDTTGWCRLENLRNLLSETV